MTQGTQTTSFVADSSAKSQVIPAKGYAARGASSPLGAFSFTRRSPRAQDVQIEILYCGVCHSDLHQARDEWHDFMPTVYPCVPGHEIVGRVVKVGSAVKKFKEGDLAAVGCMVDSCRECENCKAGEEQYCINFATFTYNAPDKLSGGVTYGGYSDTIVVDESFVLQVPKSLDLAGVAPLLCAGITTYSPLRHWQVKKGQKVGIVGLGGLGHMGVKFAHAFGAHTVLFWGLTRADPVLSGLIALLVVFSGWRVLRETTGILLEGAPPHLDVTAIERTILACPGVASVHDLHVWRISERFDMLTAHVTLKRGQHGTDVCRTVADCMREEYGLGHVTIQPEPPPPDDLVAVRKGKDGAAIQA